MVGATNKSMAAMSGAWLRRKVPQGWEGGPCRLAIYLALLDCAAECEKLAMDTWGAPQWIIDAHAPDQGPQICLDLRPTAKGSGFPAPIPAKAGTMPAHDGLGPDDRDDLEDRRKPTIELDQE